MPAVGDFVRVRSRRWLDEESRTFGRLPVVRLACIQDDVTGEIVEVWDAELDATVLADEGWGQVAKVGTDEPAVFSSYFRTLRWNTCTAADRELFQAPFRAGIHLDAFQQLPLREALKLPRVNLLIADDAGAGKTIEAGLVLCELLLRHRIDFVLVAAPAGTVRQWQDELEAKFGLSFTIVDRDFFGALRRERGYGADPWSAGSRFLLSHSLVTDETKVSGLRDLLGEFRSRSLLILHEAHHAAPASGMKYAIESQFTKTMRSLADRFKHRLFLSATPHNGHSNSFSALLEMLDPQRFTSGVPVRSGNLDPVMVRRLKSDLRHDILGWHTAPVAGAPDGPAVPDNIVVRIDESDTDIAPLWTVTAPGGGHQILVRLGAVGVDPDERSALAGCEATPHQRLERLCQEKEVRTGILVTDGKLRLIYAPRGEPRRPGGGLDQARRTGAGCPPGACARPCRGRRPRPLQARARSRPEHLYDGLLTFLERLVFPLYAEDRDLIPSSAESEVCAFCAQGYGVRSLHAHLLQDRTRHELTMHLHPPAAWRLGAAAGAVPPGALR